MEIRLNKEFNVSELFLHEKASDVLTFLVNEEWVEEKLNAMIHEMGVEDTELYDIEVKCPENNGADRFVFYVAGEAFPERCWNLKELKEYLPEKLWNILQKLDKKSIEL